MDNVENKETLSVGKFTKKFIANYIIGLILIGIVLMFVREFIVDFFPTQIKTIINFLITIFALYKISSSAIETTLKEGNINQEDVKKVLRNIGFFLIILLVLDIIVTYISFHFSAIVFSSLKNALIINLIVQIIVMIIKYTIIMMFCKNKLENMVLGKEINKKLYIILLVISVIILCAGILLDKVNRNNSINRTGKNSEISNTISVC